MEEGVVFGGEIWGLLVFEHGGVGLREEKVGVRAGLKSLPCSNLLGTPALMVH